MLHLIFLHDMDPVRALKAEFIRRKSSDQNEGPSSRKHLHRKPEEQQLQLRRKTGRESAERQERVSRQCERQQ